MMNTITAGLATGAATLVVAGLTGAATASADDNTTAYLSDVHRVYNVSGATDQQLVDLGHQVCAHMDSVEAKKEQQWPGELANEQRLVAERGKVNYYPSYAYEIGDAGVMWMRLQAVNDYEPARGLTKYAAQYFCPQHSWEIS